MTLSRTAISRAGLSDLVARRIRGEALAPAELEQARLADLLALGAAADTVRHADVGDEVRLYVGPPPSASASFVSIGPTESARGTELFRRIAVARLALPKGGRLCIDVLALGAEIAQAALAFGVSDWAGALGSRRGLPIANEGTPGAAEKRVELAGYVARAGRIAVFVEPAPRTAAQPTA
jgi:hypothetical protein